MTTPTRSRYTGHRFPPEVIGHAVWLYFRFPLGLRMVEELLAARAWPRRAYGVKGGRGFPCSEALG
jgi:transposase-like protein